MKRFTKILFVVCVLMLSMAMTAFAEEAKTVTTEAELTEALEAGGKVKLGADIDVSTAITIPSGVTVTLDLNGYDINGGWNGSSTTNHIYVISNYGTFTVEDSIGDGKIVSRGVYNYGTMILNGGTIDACDGNGGYAVNNEPGSIFKMNGGKVIASYEDDGKLSSGGGDATALDVPAGCTTTLNGGIIENVCDFTFAITAAGTLNVPANSTVVVMGAHGAIFVSAGVTTIDGGKFVSTGYTIDGGTSKRTDNVLYVSGGELNINGGTFVGDSDTASGGACIYDVAGTVTVSGGSFGGSSGGDVWGATGTTINGGTFENLIETSHVSVGAIITNKGETVVKNEDGTTTAVAAQIGTEYFATLQDAIDAVQEGETIVILGDITFTEGANGSTNGISYTRGVNFILDLNGKTITSNLGGNALRFKIGDGNSITNTEVTITIKNGKVVSGSNNWCAISGATADNSGNKLVLDLVDLTVEASKGGDYAVKSWAGAKVTAKNVTINATYAGAFYAIGGEIVLDDCTVNQQGLWSAPYLSMAVAVSKGGKATVNSGSYTTEPLGVADANNQGSSHGSWCVGVMNSGGTLIINDGTFANGNYGDDSLATAGRGVVMADTGAIVEINGGSFNAIKDIVDYLNNLNDASKNPVVTIKGGTYSANPKNNTWIKVAKGYEVVKKDGVYIVEEKIYTLADIFTFKGYSIDNDRSGIAAGFTVDFEALEAYETQNGVKLSFGSLFTAEDINNASIKTNLTSYKSVNINLIISGISIDNPAHMEANFIMALYVNDGEAISYVSAGGVGDASTVATVRYDDVVALVPSTTKEDEQ